MTVFDALADLPQRLSQPAVRDLAWTLLSPPLLVHSPLAQRHPLSAICWATTPGLLADWLLAQDADPSALQSWLARRSVRRLGLYYERLWQFALHAAPDIEVLAANLAIRQGGHTLGELDLLLRDASGVHHLELAIKLYLGHPTTAEQSAAQWIGPGSYDRLDLKLQHLGEHQLPLPQRSEAQQALGTFTDQPITSAMWLGGYLFYPPNRPCPPPAAANPQHLRGSWLHRRDWQEFVRQKPGARWQPLPRQAWLAAARLPASEGWSATQLHDWLNERPEQTNAQLLVDLQPDASGYLHERQRLFLVADSWPDTSAQ